VGESLVKVCKQISLGYEIYFVEIGTDSDHVHFLIQSVPNLSVTKIVTTIKSLTARQVFCSHPEIKKMLWGGNFWTSGYYVNSVSHFGNTTAVADYVKNQGGKYQRLHQVPLFSLD
jgi:REP element-mobilizing transposase RayT